MAVRLKAIGCRSLKAERIMKLALSEELRVQPPVVLFVEDEVLIRMAVADELRDRGFTVVEAANAVTAVLRPRP